MHQSQIIQHLFQVNSLEDVSRERLETFVEEYPSFGIGHYLLSRKLQKEDAGGFQQKTQLTCLYFSNPFWLQWLLENTDVGGQKAVPEAKAFAALPLQEAAPHPAVAEDEAPVLQEWSAVGEAPAIIHEEEPAAVINHEEVHANHDEVHANHDEEHANHAEVHANHEEVHIHDGEVHAADLVTEEAPPVENVVTMAEEAFPEEPVVAEAHGEAGASAAEQLLRSIEQARELRESLQKINTNFTEEPAPVAEPEAAMAETAVVEEPVAVEEPIAVATEPATIAHEPVAVAEEPVAVATPPAAVAAPEPVAATGIVFEPLHTIDYFASQGIKFTLDENPADQLGRQLKSFTDWLKTMRRLPQKNKEMVPDRLAEQAVQDIAAHSIEGKEVLTEAMAEVLAKQGMRQRARVVYEKLSLLNPEKSAYFAAKIEQLNIL